MNSRFDYTVLDAITNAVKTIKAAPLVLGSTATGSGGPVGGFVGYLDQYRVAYDEIEASSSGIPESGMSIVDNLNHIRYRLDTFSGGGASTFLDLSDTPNTYVTYSGKALVVNGSETGVDFISFPSGLPSLTSDRLVVTDPAGTITTYSGLRLNSTTGEVFVGDVVPSPVQPKSFNQGAEGVSAGHLMWTWGSGFASFITGFFARGVFLAPSAALLNDIALKLRSRFYDGVTYPTQNNEIRLLANENQTGTAHGGRVEIHTTPNGTTTLTKAATFGSDQSLTVVGVVSGSNLSGTNTGDSASVPINGWVSTAWAGLLRSSATVFTTTTDASTVLQKGYKIKLTDATTKYFVVASATWDGTKTTITVLPTTDFSGGLAGNPSDVYYSNVENPYGWPDWFTYTLSPTGFSSLLVNTAQYAVHAKTVLIRFQATGTSNSTAFTIQVPIAPAIRTLANLGQIADNSANPTLPGFADLNTGTTTCNLYPKLDATGWTASGLKSAGLTVFQYQM